MFNQENRLFCDKEISARIESQFGEKVKRVSFLSVPRDVLLRSVLSALRRLDLGCRATAPLSSLTAT